MPSHRDSLYVLAIVTGNLLTGAAMYTLGNLVFAGALCALGVFVAVVVCLPTEALQSDIQSKGN